MATAAKFPAPKIGFSLPREYYASPEIFEHDIEKVFLRDWLYVGHISQIPQPGDFITYEFADESIIIARTRNDEFKAFTNVCRHRGARVAQEACGNAKLFRCPYHNWIYELDGSLKSAPGMKEQLDKADFGLRPVWLDVWRGLVYINLSDDQPRDTITEWLAPAVEAVTGHGFPQMKIARTLHYDVPANWKLIMENYRECYHCRAAHPQFCTTVPVDELDANRAQGSTRLVKGALEPSPSTACARAQFHNRSAAKRSRFHWATRSPNKQCCVGSVCIRLMLLSLVLITGLRSRCGPRARHKRF